METSSFIDTFKVFFCHIFKHKFIFSDHANAPYIYSNDDHSDTCPCRYCDAPFHAIGVPCTLYSCYLLNNFCRICRVRSHNRIDHGTGLVYRCRSCIDRVPDCGSVYHTFYHCNENLELDAVKDVRK